MLFCPIFSLLDLFERSEFYARDIVLIYAAEEAVAADLWEVMIAGFRLLAGLKFDFSPIFLLFPHVCVSCG